MTIPHSVQPDQQLPYDQLPSGSVDDDTLAILRLIEGDPLHDQDRTLVVRAIVEEGRSAHGMVDPNKVRERINHAVLPQVVGLAVAGWTTNLDKAGRNSGKPCRTYWLVGGAE